MEYNKYQFSKANDKKVLHKIGKQWKVISVALLMALGGTAVATHVSHASANTNNQNDNTNQVTNNHSNHQQATLVNTPKVSNTNSTSKQASNVSSQDITQQANDLHKNILLNNVNEQSQSSEAPASSAPSESKVGSSASSNINKYVSSATNKITPKLNNVGDQQNNNSDITYGTYAGMNYKYNKQNNSVEFTNGIMSDNAKFGSSALDESSYIRNASKLTFDKAVNTNNVYDASDMFANDQNLKSLSLPKNFVRNATNASEMFTRDYSLFSLKIPKGFGQNISWAPDMFSNDGFINLIFPQGFGTSISYAPGMFESDHNIATLNLPRGFAQKNNDASDMFADDKKLKSLNLPKDFGSVITNADSMFSGDKNLKALMLPDGFGSEISDADGMFNDDTNLNLLGLPSGFGNKINGSQLTGSDIFTHKVIDEGTDDEGMFDYVPSLYSDGIVDSSHELNAYGKPIFSYNMGERSGSIYMHSKSDIDIPLTNTISYHDIYSDVDGMKNPASKTVSGNITKPYIYSSKDIPRGFAMVGLDGRIIDPDKFHGSYGFKFDSNKGQTNHVINIAPVYNGMTYKYDKAHNSVEFVSGTMKNGARFDNINNPSESIWDLHSIIIDSDVNTNNVTNAEGMFSGPNIANITNIDLPNNFGKNIINANNMFAKNDLTKLNLPQGFGEKISDAECMFNDTKLRSLNLPKGFGENIHNAAHMFSYIPSLNTLILPNNFGKKITNAIGMFGSDDAPLYLKDNDDNYTASIPMATHIEIDPYHTYDKYSGTPNDPHNLAGTWVTKRNPKPTINVYSSIYHDSYVAEQDAKYAATYIDNDTKYADRNALSSILTDGSHIQSDQFNIESDLSDNNMSALNNANQQASLANSAANNAKSLYNDAKSAASVDYNNIYSKSYNAYYDASVASNDANENIIKSNASASAQISNDAMMINSARSAINTDYATYNVSSASTEDSIAQNALKDANSLYQSISNSQNSQNSASASANYSKIYNAYYNASYASSAENGLAKNSNVTDNASLSANVAQDTNIESSAMSAIRHDFSVDNASAVSNANVQEQKAHSAWTDANNVIYNANEQANNAVYYVNYVDNNGNTVLHKVIRSLKKAKRFVPFGYSFNKVAGSSVVNGKHVMTIDVIPEF